MTSYEAIPKALAETPVGFCQCGCGQTTPVAKQTRTDIGHIRGEHIAYILGHNRRKSPVEYLVQDCGYATPCWVWQRCSTRGGYGMMYDGSAMRLAHRLYYETLVGAIPEGLELDHLCRNRACVNPAHLEPVTAAENHHRGDQSKLSVSDVKYIRQRWRRGTAQSLAARFGVSESAIYRAANGTTWGCVE